MKPVLRALALAGAVLAPLPLAAQQWDAAVAAAASRVAPQMIAVRHDIHQHPELSNREFRTARLVAAHLRSLGFEVDTGIAHTGVVGILRGGRPGPVVAVRADMDALPVKEDTPYPFRSTATGEYMGKTVDVSHACGHDVHTAVQMGVATVLAGMKDRVPGTIVFLFQPAEEGAPPGEEGGAKLMMQEGVFNRWHPTAVFGLHTFAQMQTGNVGYTPGPAMAASDRFTVNIHGRQAHGASPQLSIDPVVMAAQAILALQTIRSRNLSPFEPSVLTVGMVRGGERFNIIPSDVTLMGTVRTFDPRVQDEIERRMREILDGVTKGGGGTYDMEYQRTTPVTVNNRELSDRMRPTMVRLMGAQNVLDVPPTTGAEDFAFFSNAVPGFFYRLGTVKPGTTSGDHHTPTFQADDDAIPIGIRMMSTLLLDYLSSGGVRASTAAR
ncbi:amidohydrolase [Longimicrobium sp.]|uniref:M20 metallopeptidase family protein n=1 Tax=Longimicrobium sp. TaxID=2029185 RepID=UPI002C4B6928|nr:amidohydrolase [Longimicrobium sp.]HSU16668.1 amidohydrolase [Longimicrobium sp.]